MSKFKWGILSTANIGIKRVIPAIMAGERGTVTAIASRDAREPPKSLRSLASSAATEVIKQLLDDPA
jgi:predicted dehydrogenase